MLDVAHKAVSNCNGKESPWYDVCINPFRSEQNGCLFPDDIFKCSFMNDRFFVPILISLKFVP